VISGGINVIGNIDDKFYGKKNLEADERTEAKELLRTLEYELTLSYLVHHG